MDYPEFIPMFLERNESKRTRDVVSSADWNELWNLNATQGDHSEEYLSFLHEFLFSSVDAWVPKVNDSFSAIEPKSSTMTQPVGRDEDGKLWTFPATVGIVNWGAIQGNLSNQTDLSNALDGKALKKHKHNIKDITISDKSIAGSSLADGSIPTTAYANLSVTADKLGQESVETNKIKDSAISTAKVASEAITRDKLANNALYSPVLNLSSASYYMIPSDIGKTISISYDLDSSDIVLNLTQDNSQGFAVGSEVAVFYLFGQSLKIVTTGVRIAAPDIALSKNITLQIPEKYYMIALKKMVSDTSNGDIWTVQGNVEVVE